MQISWCKIKMSYYSFFVTVKYLFPKVTFGILVDLKDLAIECQCKNQLSVFFLLKCVMTYLSDFPLLTDILFILTKDVVQRESKSIILKAPNISK